MISVSSVALDGGGVQVFHDAHALVALDDVEPVHVLVGLDGRVDALADDRLIQPLPLGHEFAALVDGRHEVGGKRGGAAVGGRAHDLIQRDAHQPQRPGGQRQRPRHHLVQHGQIGILMPALAQRHFALAQFERFVIYIIHHLIITSVFLLLYNGPAPKSSAGMLALLGLLKEQVKKQFLSKTP